MKQSDLQLFRLAARVGRRLLRQGLTVASAESCTGGWVAKALTDIAGSSAWFVEGFVTYSNASKVMRLGVPAMTLRKSGAVSRSTVRAMALGALRRSGAQVTVAVTGIAGPGGAVPGKPVGTVWIAWATRRGKGIRIVVEHRRFRGTRDLIRRKTALAALQGLLR